MASFVVGAAAKQLGALLVEETKRLYAVSDSIKRLHKELEWMQCFLEDADNRQHKEKVVRKWVAEIKDFAYEAEDLIERYLHQISYPRQQGAWNNIKWSLFFLRDALNLHDIGSNIDDLRSRISDLTSKLQVYGVQIIKHEESSKYNSTKEQRRTHSHTHTEEVPVGLEEHIAALMERLVNKNDFKVVAITGMGGLGKTTLAKKVYTEKQVDDHFDNRVWVYVSKKFKPSNVFREILSQLGENGENPEMICKALREKKCLVVLDDVWDSDAWDTLRPAFPSNGTTGSKILITSRKMGVVSRPDGCSYDSYKKLSDDDCWKLLQKRALLEGDTTEAEDYILWRFQLLKNGQQKSNALNGDEVVRPEMEKLGREMLKHCHGLPLAIVALGGILASRRTIKEWETVLNSITSYLTRDKGQEGGSHNMLPMLELSYDELPFYLKPCFMYLGCFPKESEISAQRLYHLWEAEGIFSISVDDMEESEGVSLDDIAKSYLNELVKRSMVQVEKRWANGEIKTCRLHGIMRDMCLKKCEEVNFLKVVKHDRFKELSNYTTTKLRRCVLDLGNGDVNDSPFAEHLNETSCIRSLLAFLHGSHCAGKLLSGNFGNFLSLLRVLDLEGTSIDLVPEVIGEFIHLRYFSLRRTGASGILQCIWTCRYLETLDLRTGSTLTLRNEFQKLERLRHLYLPSCMKLLDPTGKLVFSHSQLRRMETLKNFDIERCETAELMEMTNLRKFSFIKTKQLKDKEILRYFMDSPVIKNGLGNQLHLNIRSDVISGEPEILTKLDTVEVSLQLAGKIELSSEGSYEKIYVNNLKRVCLEGGEVSQGEISVLEGLPHLKELRLNKKALKDHKMSFSNGGFLQLAMLYFCQLDLEEWEVGEGALPKLRCLFIYLCKRLTRIPSGLPSSVWIYCRDRVDGMERYKTCPYPEEAADQTW